MGFEGFDSQLRHCPVVLSHGESESGMGQVGYRVATGGTFQSCKTGKPIFSVRHFRRSMVINCTFCPAGSLRSAAGPWSVALAASSYPSSLNDRPLDQSLHRCHLWGCSARNPGQPDCVMFRWKLLICKLWYAVSLWQNIIPITPFTFPIRSCQDNILIFVQSQNWLMALSKMSFAAHHRMWPCRW